MRVKIPELKNKMTQVLKVRGYSARDIPFLIDMFLGGELRGHTSHGLAGFSSFVRQDFSKLAKPKIVKSTPGFILMDAKSNSGNVVGREVADQLMKRARKQVVATAFIKNMDSWLRPGAIAEYIADRDFFAIVINHGGGASIAPPGGYDPVLGTNPIAYGIPTNEGPIVVDMATAKRAWGQVRLANKYGTKLPDQTFYDNKGNVTRDPKKAWSVMPFGEYKGFALGFLVEMMCGSLLGMPMMVNTNNAGSKYGVNMLNRGAFILVVSPRSMTNLKTFKSENSRLIKKIKATRHRKGERIRIPGENASGLKADRLKKDSIELPRELWRELQSL